MMESQVDPSWQAVAAWFSKFKYALRRETLSELASLREEIKAIPNIGPPTAIDLDARCQYALESPQSARIFLLERLEELEVPWLVRLNSRLSEPNSQPPSSRSEAELAVIQSCVTLLATASLDDSIQIHRTTCILKALSMLSRATGHNAALDLERSGELVSVLCRIGSPVGLGFEDSTHIALLVAPTARNEIIEWRDKFCVQVTQPILLIRQ